MTARMYFPQKVSGNTIILSDREQVHYLRDVLRMVPGDEVDIFDIDGNEYRCVISSLDRKQAALKIERSTRASARKHRIAIACAVPKKSRMDDIVDMLTQLGVDVIIPLGTDRMVVKLGKDSEARLERWRRIARSAAEQSRRNTLPVITEVMSLREVLDLAKDYQLKLVPNLAGPHRPLRDITAGAETASILVMIGPEGDFTVAEIEESLRSGFVAVSLGSTVLRVETAAVAVAAYLRLKLGE